MVRLGGFLRLVESSALPVATGLLQWPMGRLAPGQPFLCHLLPAKSNSPPVILL